MFSDSISTFAWSIVSVIGAIAALAWALPALLDWRGRVLRQPFAVSLAAAGLEQGIGEQLRS